MDKTPSRPDRTLIVIISVIAALVVISLIVVFSRGTAPLLPASTPEGVVQRYSSAVIAGDEEAARDYLVREVRDSCDRNVGETTENLRINLVSTESHGESVDVRVSLITSYADSGPFGNSQYESEEVFELVKEDGEWVIESAPWALKVCANEVFE